MYVVTQVVGSVAGYINCHFPGLPKVASPNDKNNHNNTERSGAVVSTPQDIRPVITVAISATDWGFSRFFCLLGQILGNA
jgi:hypothetical protein